MKFYNFISTPIVCGEPSRQLSFGGTWPRRHGEGQMKHKHEDINHDSCFWIEMKWWHSIGRFKVLLEHFPMETHSALYITAQIYFALDYRHTAWLHALLGSECCTYSHKRLCLHMQLCQQSYSSDLQPWSFHLNYHTHICLNNKHCI